MPKAIWNSTVLAESNNCEIVESNYYFPPDAINRQYFKDSSKHTICGWKGTANYYDIEVNGQVKKDAAWYYPEAKEAAKKIEGYVAFYGVVKIEP